MHSRRKTTGYDSRPLAAPSSTGSYSKSKKRSVMKRYNLWLFVLVFLLGCIFCAYVFAIFYLTGGNSSGSSLNEGSGTRGASESSITKPVTKPKTATETKRRARTKIAGSTSDWREDIGGGPTPEGQKQLHEEQTHVPKDLDDLIPQLRNYKDMHKVVQRGQRTKHHVFKKFSKDNRVQLDKKYDKKGNLVYEPQTSVHKDDLVNMGFNEADIKALGNVTNEEVIKGRERLVDILHEAGIDDIAPEAIALLPQWSSVVDLYGEEPVILGLERCEEFRSQADPDDASVGIAGMFNTGTNPMAMYVSNNLKMPNNKKDKAGGTRWQVPWGKHRLATEKYTNTPPHEKRTNKTNVLPIVLVRDPYTWMQSMCKHQYESRWPHNANNNCPNLAEAKLNSDGTPKRVQLKLKYHPPIFFDSLADYWGQWYKEYLEADYPRLIVRFEDIHFHAREVVETIAQCAGAVPREDDALFRYIVSAAKWGSAHTTSKTNMISAMVKYGTEKGRFKGFKDTDWLIAEEIFTAELMELFGYKYPEHLAEKQKK